MTRSRELKARHAAAVTRGVGTKTVYVERALNAELWDVDGRRFIDMAAGIAVNNGIILIEFILQRRRDLNESDFDAAMAAGSLRFRPILMTMMTTLLGMFPLAMGIGAGADFYQPLAISVSGGLLVSTLITLTFVPTIFIMAENIISFIKSFMADFTR